MQTNINVFTHKKRGNFVVESHNFISLFRFMRSAMKNAHVIDPMIISLRIASFHLFFLLREMRCLVISNFHISIGFETHFGIYIPNVWEKTRNFFFCVSLCHSRVSYHDRETKKNRIHLHKTSNMALIVWRMVNGYFYLIFVSMANYLFPISLFDHHHWKLFRMAD